MILTLCVLVGFVPKVIPSLSVPVPAVQSVPLAVNHGGVIVAAVPGVRVTSVDIGVQPVTFEPVFASHRRLRHRVSMLLIYRPGSVAVSAEFFRELSDTLDQLVTMSSTLIIAGDLNVRLDRCL